LSSTRRKAPGNNRPDPKTPLRRAPRGLPVCCRIAEWLPDTLGANPSIERAD
jgi:hypothetical protein